MQTVRFALVKLTAALGTMIVASILIFGALHMAPGSPIDVIVGNRTVDADTRASLERQYGLDEPIVTQYAIWLKDVLQGDLGDSIITGNTVNELIWTRTQTTVLLVLLATVFTVIAGVLIGTIGATAGGVTDGALSTLTSGFLATPAFIAGNLLLLVFAVEFGWFPTFGPGEGLLDRLWHLVLPSGALAIALLAHTARVTRAAVQEEMVRAHVETAKIRGFTRSHVLKHHVFRNALIPVVTISGLTFASMLGAAVVVEQVFQLQGIGSLLIQSVGRNDFPVVQGVALVIVAFFVLVNTLVDLLYPLLDPRLRRSGK